MGTLAGAATSQQAQDKILDIRQNGRHQEKDANNEGGDGRSL